MLDDYSSKKLQTAKGLVYSFGFLEQSQCTITEVTRL